MWNRMTFLSTLIVLCLGEYAMSNSFDTQGPTFTSEPPFRLEFTNTAGSRADCTARGNPTPLMEWMDQDNNPVSTIQSVRHILGNGSLYFSAFDAGSFRQDVHWATYKCTASNSVGTILSRDMSVKAVVNQRYDPEVQNPGGFIGGNVLIKCNIPSFVQDYVSVTSWLQQPSFNIYPSIESDGKYHMLPTGELLIINVTRTDAQRSYRCRTHHQLTQEAVVSDNIGRIQLTDMREPVPPIMNDKLIQLTGRIDDVLVLPCVAYASPKPTYRWHVQKNNRDEYLDNSSHQNHRVYVRDGTLVISSIKKTDAGTYFCIATNSEGSETLEVQLSITSPLTVHIQPTRQTVDLGKSAELLCNVNGFPRTNVWWLKDAQPLRTGSRVRLLTKEHIKITSVTKEDRGMYQCFVKNENDAVQATAEMKLGEVAPQLVYKFIEQTMQPGPSVSLKCSATGNPTPQISWSLDGFPMPNDDRLMIGQYVAIFGDVISHVNISVVKSDDGGEYSCTAKSRAGSMSHAGRLNIYGMPFVRAMPSLSAVAGKSLTIKCPAAGYPIDSIVWEKVPPKITPFSFARDLNVGDRTSVQCVVGTGDLPLIFTWLKDDQKIIQSIGSGGTESVIHKSDIGIVGTLSGSNGESAITIRQYDDFTSSLSITSVTRSQGGNYTCKVQNDAAMITHSAQLRVNVPPRISPFNFEDDITEGMRTQLMCSSSQGDQPFNITWLRDQQPINTVEDQTININEYAPFSSILTIHNLTSRHNGNYTCEISNRGGTVDYTALLSVAVPPRWIIEPQDQSAVLGNSVIITCKADGFPLPVVHWKQSIGEQSGEYRELNYAGGNSGIESHPNGSLIITKVSQEHNGNFLCQANNGIGASLSKLIRLTVHVGPTVTVRNKKVSVRRGDRIGLRCEADGDQPLDVSWRSKGNRIDPTYDVRYQLKNSPLVKGIISELTIVQTTLNDRGEYSCIAINAYGHDHAALHLQVQEPPSFPKNLQITELGSRSIVLSWQPNEQDVQSNHYGDAMPISNFILQFKEAQDVWNDHNNQKLLPGDKTTAIITQLKPSTSYHFRLYAENHLGKSAPSDILHLVTDAEIPGGPPLMVTVEPMDAQQLLVTWRPPERELWNGELLGYTIGYHKFGGSDQSYNYTKVGIPGGEGVNDFRLIGLDKYTQYSVTVQAFNIKGDGPASEPVIAHTLEDVPSAPPQAVNCVALTSQNIQVTWQAPPKEYLHGVIQGYKLLYEPVNTDIEYGARETKITSALNTVLHGLQPYTNYSVQVVAFTRAGEGVASPITSCITEETVPDAPERIKSVVNTESSVIISWLPPRRQNGVVTKYTVYIRILDKGQEVKIVKDILLAQNHHYEAKDLNMRETYEAWVTASTKTGQGPSTTVIKLTPSSTIAAAVISFGQTLSVAWRVDVKLPCLFVGIPKPHVEWRILDSKSSKQQRLETDVDNTLTLRNVQRHHEGNYTCQVRNNHGTDHITYQLFVQVPPEPPKLIISSTTITSVALEWIVGDNGGSQFRGFLLAYRREFDEWEEIVLDRRSNSYLLEHLQCGTRYQFTLAAFNKIGSGTSSSIENARTKGNKPVAPHRQHLIRANVTSVQLELAAWQDGGCPITYFTVEFRRNGHGSDWILVSSNIAPQARFMIPDLEPQTAYNLRLTAHNNAGSTITEYFFETLNLLGAVAIGIGDEDSEASVGSLFKDVNFVIISILMMIGMLIAVGGVCFFLKPHFRTFLGRNDGEPIQSMNSKHSIPEHRDQYYATVRKTPQSPCRDSSGALERIPEYSEDIYPYATFHLPDQENFSGNPNRHGHSGQSSSIYDTRDTLSMKQVRSNASSQQNVGTGKRGHGRKSKTQKSESEEYDSLGSDAESGSGEHGTSSRKDHLDDSGPVNFSSHAHSPGSRSGKERLAVFSRSTHHIAFSPPAQQFYSQAIKNYDFLNLDALYSQNLSTSTEKLQISESRPNHYSKQNRSPSGRHSVDTSFDLNDFDPPPKIHNLKHQPQYNGNMASEQHHNQLSAGYQNISHKHNLSQLPSSMAIIQNTNNKLLKNATVVGPSNISDIDLINSTLNKSYGDFLTMTPRRKSRLLAATRVNDQWPSNYRSSSAPIHMQDLVTTTNSPASSQIQAYCWNTYRTTDTFSNADTVRLGSDLWNHRSNFITPSTNSSKYLNHRLSTTSNNDSIANQILVIQQHPTHADNDKIHSTAYANVSPPSAFSDTGNKCGISSHGNRASGDWNGNGNVIGSKHSSSNASKYDSVQKDFTIAV